MNVSAHHRGSSDWTVLDSQSVFDWCYFQDPCTARWEAWRLAGRWCWVADASLRAELVHVLERGVLPARSVSAQAVLDWFDARVLLLPTPAPGLAPALRCSDPDDQKFIDLALSQPVRWLVSRDRAVLKLRRRAGTQHGLTVLPPSAWAPGDAEAASHP